MEKWVYEAELRHLGIWLEPSDLNGLWIEVKPNVDGDWVNLNSDQLEIDSLLDDTFWRDKDEQYKKKKYFRLASGIIVPILRIEKHDANTPSQELQLHGKKIGDGAYGVIHSILIINQESLIQLRNEARAATTQIKVTKIFRDDLEQQTPNKSGGRRKKPLVNKKVSYEREKAVLARSGRLYGTLEQIIHTKVKIGDTEKTRTQYENILCMEWAEGDNLWDKENKKILQKFADLPPARKFYLLALIAIDLQKLHAKNIIHRDIKPDNIVVNIDENDPSEDSACVVDLGSSVFTDEPANQTPPTLLYLPDEIINEEKSYDQTSDLYAFYITFLEILGLTQTALESVNGNQWLRILPDPDKNLADVLNIENESERQAVTEVQKQLVKGISKIPHERVPLGEIIPMLLKTAKTLDPQLPIDDIINKIKEERNKLSKQNVLDATRLLSALDYKTIGFTPLLTLKYTLNNSNNNSKQKTIIKKSVTTGAMNAIQLVRHAKEDEKKNITQDWIVISNTIISDLEKKLKKSLVRSEQTIKTYKRALAILTSEKSEGYYENEYSLQSGNSLMDRIMTGLVEYIKTENAHTPSQSCFDFFNRSLHKQIALAEDFKSFLEGNRTNEMLAQLPKVTRDFMKNRISLALKNCIAAHTGIPHSELEKAVTLFVSQHHAQKTASAHTIGAN